MGTYRLEYASSGRAVCQHGECKKEKVKIPKGGLRQGVWLDYGDFASWRWRHWGCVTVEVIKNITDSIKNDDGEVDFDQLDGFDELLDDDQDRVREAIDKGHIDDGDLMDGMDVTLNRPGAKQALREQAKADKQAAKEREKQAKEALKDHEKAQKQLEKDKKKVTAKEEKEKEKEKEAKQHKKDDATAKRLKKSESDDEDEGASPPAAKRPRTQKRETTPPEPTVRTRVKRSRANPNATKVKEESDVDEKPKSTKQRTRATRIKEETPETHAQSNSKKHDVKVEAPDSANASEVDTKPAKPAKTRIQQKQKPKSTENKVSPNTSRRVTRSSRLA